MASPGLLAGAYLKKAGVDDVHVIEMGGDFGGVWYWNRFPGIQCDNDAYCYIPLLEELDFMPSKKFADGAEIFEHCKRIGKHFGLYDGAIFSTQVRTVRWDEDDQAVAADHQPWRRHPCPLRGHDTGLLQPAEAARHPRDQGLFKGHTSSTRRAGTTTTPAETPTADWTSWRTSASRSSAPARRVCSSFRISVGMPSTCTCFSARRRRWTCAATSRRIRSGRAVVAARLAGGAQAQLPPLVTVRRRCGLRCSRTRSATSGPNSAAT